MPQSVQENTIQNNNQQTLFSDILSEIRNSSITEREDECERIKCCSKKFSL